MILLNIMANVARPVLRQTKLSFAPVAPPPDDARRNSPPPVSTRRTSKSSPLLVLADNEQAVKQAEHTPTPVPVLTAPAARSSNSSNSNNRKRPAADLEPEIKDSRPPTKITVTQPHGDLVRITNGVAVPLASVSIPDRVPSARSTPRPASAGKLAAPAPASASTSTSSKDKRSLRSHDGGSRLKSDLAVYFGNYDDVIAGLPKPSELLELDTPINLIDEPLKTKSPSTSDQAPRSSPSPTRSRKSRLLTSPRHASTSGAISVPPTQSSTTFQVLDLTIYNDPHDPVGEDPLADSVYFTQHRRAERKEKQLRNIEKERAMHEKVQLERLLDGLLGPDWLKVMGITGVTDGEKKDWEAKRDYFVREVEALVDKFRQWKSEEKRLRAEKEAALAAKESPSSSSSEDEQEEPDQARDVKRKAPPVPPKQPPKEPEPPKPRRPPRPHGFLLPFVPPEPVVPFESFYTKPHLRAAALGKHRHGRNATAFGQPIPEFEEHEFELPHDFIDPQYLRDNARQRRRRKRESAVNQVSSAQ